MNDERDLKLEAENPAIDANAEGNNIAPADFKTLFNQNVYQYPDWYLPFANKATKVLKYQFAVYAIMTIMVFYIWPWMYGNPFVPAKYPEWYTALINFCLEHIPSAQRHANFFQPGMRGYIKAIYTLQMLFFIPVIINVALLDLRNLSTTHSHGRVKKTTPVKYYLLGCFTFVFAIIMLFFIGQDKATDIYDLHGKGTTMINMRWSYILFLSTSAFGCMVIIGIFFHTNIKYSICAFQAHRKVVKQGEINESSNEHRHQ